MLNVDNNNSIKLTRGDTARLSVPITNEITNYEYFMAEGDTLTLTVKKSVKDSEHVLQKVSVGSNFIHISPNDTKNLDFGKYKYDVELTTASGDVYTVIEPTSFEITSEVTW